MEPTSAIPARTLSRRRLLEGLVLAPTAAIILAACGEGETASSSTTASSGGSGSTTGGASSTASASAATGEAWASGGTDLITVGYPDDAVFEAADTCTVTLTEAATEGPCYFQSDTGEDISLGKTGLPMQLCLKLVGPDCEPLSGYTIEAWHCDNEGIYSGDTSESDDDSSFAGDFCTGGDEEAESAIYFRGQLTTDDAGRVNFKSCFPGWYAGRTIHIHFAVTDPSGTTRVISQFAFADELTEEICTTHDLYADRGIQDTTLSSGNDSVFPSDDYENYLLGYQRNSDGTLLGFGVIQIDPESVATEAGGAGGGGGQPPSGGPGGDGGPGEPPSDDA